jgi:hypothetical protein
MFAFTLPKITSLRSTACRLRPPGIERELVPNPGDAGEAGDAVVGIMLIASTTTLGTPCTRW